MFRARSSTPTAIPEPEYSIEVARQRFSLWAACRAAQAGSAKARRFQLIAALKACGVVQWIADDKNHVTEQEVYDQLFNGWVRSILRHLRENHDKTIAYGVAAKLVSTYLKSAFILGGCEFTRLGTHVMPPIASVLLKTIDRKHKKNFSARFKWQKLTEKEYAGWGRPVA
jgi:hypothetical protein